MKHNLQLKLYASSVLTNVTLAIKKLQHVVWWAETGENPSVATLNMRAFQSLFRRKKDMLLYEQYREWKRILNGLLFLFNLRPRLFGINQVRSAYMSSLNKDANVEVVPGK